MHGHVSLLAHRFCPQSTLAKHYWTLSLQITAKKATWGSIIERRQPSWPVWELEWSWLHKHLPSYFLEVTRTCDFLCAFHLDNPMVGPSFTNFSIITSAQESWCFSFFKKINYFPLSSLQTYYYFIKRAMLHVKGQPLGFAHKTFISAPSEPAPVIPWGGGAWGITNSSLNIGKDMLLNNAKASIYSETKTTISKSSFPISKYFYSFKY